MSAGSERLATLYERQAQSARRQKARRAGLASGRARRAHARGRATPHRRDRALALALAYPVAQLTQEAFAKRYAAHVIAQEGICVSERGLATAYELYRADWATYRAKSQDFQTTNGQRAAALAGRGRARSTRTVQRTRKRLAAMGLVRYHHVRRGGARPGQRDSLRVCLLQVRGKSFVTPPSAAPAAGVPPSAAGARPAVGGFDSAGCAGRNHRAAAPPRLAPPEGGRDHPPAKPARKDSTEEGGPAPPPRPAPLRFQSFVTPDRGGEKPGPLRFGWL